MATRARCPSWWSSPRWLARECMRISYSRHARFRMVGRGVSEDDVRQCLTEHVQRLQTAKQNQYKGDVGGRMLKVWVAPDRDTDLERFVVSVAWEDDDDDS
jgi:hypothetical protein